MRYIIETTELGEQKVIWNSILAFEKQGFIKIFEKGDPIEDMKENLRRIARSMQLLEKVGIDTALLEAWIKRKNPSVSIKAIHAALASEREFFKRLGIELR